MKKYTIYLLSTLILFFAFATTGFSQGMVFDWAGQFGGSDNIEARAIATDDDNNIYVAGDFEGTFDFDPGSGTFSLSASDQEDAFVCKLAPNGSLKWAIQFSGDESQYAYGIGVDDSGYVYISGGFEDTSDFDPGNGVYNLVSLGNTDIFVCKIDSSGNLVWVKSMGSASAEDAVAIAVDELGNSHITGYFWSTIDFDPGPGVANITALGSRDIFVCKLDHNGNYQWAKQLAGNSSEEGFDIALDQSGNVFTTGRFSATVDFDPGPATYNLHSAGNSDVFISKLDPSGGFVYAVGFGGNLIDDGYSLGNDATGNTYIAGKFNGTADFDPGPDSLIMNSFGLADIFIAKFNPTGKLIWAKQIGGVNHDNVNDIVLLDDDKLCLTGSFYQGLDFDPGPAQHQLNSVGSWDAYICQLDTSGSFNWVKQIGGNLIESGNAIATDGMGNIITAGNFSGTADFDPDTIATFSLSSVGLTDAFVQKLKHDNVGIQPVENEPILMYPNPTSDHIVLQWKNKSTEAQVVVRNLIGQAVSRHIWETDEVLRIELPNEKGIFLVEILSKQFHVSRKIVKN